MVSPLQAMWSIFMRSGNPRVCALMETGIRFMQVRDLRGALGVFNEIIKIEPSFAEGEGRRLPFLTAVVSGIN